MALLFAEGFDWVDPSLTFNDLRDEIQKSWQQANFDNDNSDSGIAAGRIEAQSLAMANSDDIIVTPLLNDHTVNTSGIIGFAMRTPSSFSSAQILGWNVAGTTGANFRVTGSGELHFNILTSNLASGGLTGVILNPNQWYYIELDFDIADAGRMTLHLDGAVVYDNQSIDLRHSSRSAGWTQIVFNGITANSNTVERQRLDDIYICDHSGTLNNAPLGPIQVKALLPDADGFQNDFTSSSGSANHFEDVNENPDDETTFLESSTSGHRELFSHEPSQPLGQIHGVYHSASVRVTDNIARNVSLSTRHNTTTTDNVSISVGNSEFTHISAPYDNNPAASGLWSEANLDNTQFGILID